MNEGADVLVEIFNEYDTLHLGDTFYKITEKRVTYQKQEVGITDSAVAYEFLTPWIALNQENYMKFYGMKNSLERNEFLGKTWSGIFCRFSSRSVIRSGKADLRDSVRPEKVSVKGVHLDGIYGYSSEYLMPDLFGLEVGFPRVWGGEKGGEVSHAAGH